MATGAKQRIEFHSVFKASHWEVTQAGDTVSSHRTQREAEHAAAFAGRAIWNAHGLGKAIFHRKDDTIRAERSYGAEHLKTKEGKRLEDAAGGPAKSRVLNRRAADEG